MADNAAAKATAKAAAKGKKGKGKGQAYIEIDDDDDDGGSGGAGSSSSAGRSTRDNAIIRLLKVMWSDLAFLASLGRFVDENVFSVLGKFDGFGPIASLRLRYVGNSQTQTMALVGELEANVRRPLLGSYGNGAHPGNVLLHAMGVIKANDEQTFSITGKNAYIEDLSANQLAAAAKVHALVTVLDQFGMFPMIISPAEGRNKQNELVRLRDLDKMLRKEVNGRFRDAVVRTLLEGDVGALHPLLASSSSLPMQQHLLGGGGGGAAPLPIGAGMPLLLSTSAGAVDMGAARTASLLSPFEDPSSHFFKGPASSSPLHAAASASLLHAAAASVSPRHAAAASVSPRHDPTASASPRHGAAASASSGAGGPPHAAAGSSSSSASRDIPAWWYAVTEDYLDLFRDTAAPPWPRAPFYPEVKKGKKEGNMDDDGEESDSN
jgi:hypothetical protein